MDNKALYWFPAKRYGWGWGLPVTWQGWVVFIVWSAVFLSIFPLVILRHQLIEHALFLVLMIAVLIVICYWKGEPPRWRWGD